MSGVYGEIDSRADYFRVLDEARALARQILQRNPKNPTMESIDTQLDAMWRWTQNGRAPSKDERDSIVVGVLAARELDDVQGDPEVERLASLLHNLQSYFEDWPTDDEAANAQGEFWKKFGV